MRNFLKAVLKFLLVVAILALIVGGVLYGFFVRVVEVGHNAMAPTVIAGDKVLVWRSNSGFDLGDIVLCSHPRQADRYVMGRIVGKPGHLLDMERNVFHINNHAPDTDLHGTMRFMDVELGREVNMQWGEETLLDHDHYISWLDGREPRMRARRVSGGFFLMSDNRTYRGEDSRTFGEVQAGNCIGTVFMRLTAAPSPDEIGNGPLDILE